MHGETVKQNLDISVQDMKSCREL